MVDLTASTVVSESQSQKRSQVWIEKIQHTLQHHYTSPVKLRFFSHMQEDRYYCVASKILVGVFLCVFARESLRPSISNVSSRTRELF